MANVALTIEFLVPRLCSRGTDLRDSIQSPRATSVAPEQILELKPAIDFEGSRLVIFRKERKSLDISIFEFRVSDRE